MHEDCVHCKHNLLCLSRPVRPDRWKCACGIVVGDRATPNTYVYAMYCTPWAQTDDDFWSIQYGDGDAHRCAVCSILRTAVSVVLRERNLGDLFTSTVELEIERTFRQELRDDGIFLLEGPDHDYWSDQRDRLSGLWRKERSAYCRWKRHQKKYDNNNKDRKSVV